MHIERTIESRAIISTGRLRRSAAALGLFLCLALPAAAQNAKKDGLTGWDYFREKRWTEALELLKQDHRMWPKVHEIIDGIGWCHYFLGDYDLADEFFKKALAIAPEYRYSQMGLESTKSARLGPISQAESLLSQSRWAEALQLFTDIVGGKGSDELKTRALRGKGYCHYYLGQYQQAQKDLTQVIRTAKDDAVALAGIGYVQYARKNWNEAEVVLESSLKIAPNDLEAQLTWAWCALQRSDFKKAEERFARALEISPQSWGAYLGLGWCADKKKSEDAAIDAFRKALRITLQAATDEVLTWAKRSPKRMTLLVEYAWSLLEAGSATQAKTILKAIPPDVDPDQTMLAEATALLNTADNIGAMRAAKSLLDRQKDPERAFRLSTQSGASDKAVAIGVSASTILGWALLRTGDLAEALQAFVAANDKLKARGDALTGLGYTHIAMAKMIEAEKDFQEALNAAPGYGAATTGLNEVTTWRFADYNRAWTRLEAGALEDAELRFNALRSDTSGRFPSARGDLIDYSLGVVARRMGKPDKAEALFQAALQKNPTSGEAAVGLGWAQLTQKKLAEATVTLESAVAMRPDDYEPHNLLAKVLIAAGKTSEASNRLAMWTKKFYLDAEMAKMYANLLMDEKRWVEARIALNGALSVDPNCIAKEEIARMIGEHQEFIPLHGTLGWAYFGLGRHKEAFEEFKLAVEKEPGEALHQKGRALTAGALGDEATAKTAAEIYFASLDKTSLAAAAERRSLSMTLAWDSYNIGSYKSALDQFQKIEKAEAGKEGADLLTALGWTWQQMAKPAKAREYFLRALAISPRLESALQGIEAANKSEGR